MNLARHGEWLSPLAGLGCLMAAVWSANYANPMSPDLPFVSDFGTFAAAGRAAVAGFDPYGPAAGVERLIAGQRVVDYNQGPPASVLALLPLGWLDQRSAFIGWYVVSLGLYLATFVLLCWAYRPSRVMLRGLWAISLYGLWLSLLNGQITMPVVLASAAAWVLLERGRVIPAGLLIGFVVALRPNLLPWPILLGLAGAWPAALSAGVMFGALSLLPVLVFGLGIYPAWIGALVSLSWPFLPENVSFLGVASRMGTPWVGVALSAALLLLLAVWAWRARPDPARLTPVAIVGALLVSPTAWSPYTLLLLPLFFSRAWSPLLLAAAVLLVVPGNLVGPLETESLLLWGSLRCLAVLLVFCELVLSTEVNQAAVGEARVA